VTTIFQICWSLSTDIMYLNVSACYVTLFCCRLKRTRLGNYNYYYNRCGNSYYYCCVRQKFSGVFCFLTPSYKIRFVRMKFIFRCNELHLTNVGHIADYCVWTEPTQKFWEAPELNAARYLKNVIYHVYRKIVFSFLRFIKRSIYI